MAIRLINTKSLTLETFLGDQAPEYSILSHTWSSDGEMSHYEMLAVKADRNHQASQKSGYRKIMDTCRQSSIDGIEYCWIDTCCIDKTSSSELSEAINSMFKWYQQAKVCYVLLPDITASSDITTQLPSCRWFSRGWCLQELLAPSSVKFYDKDWNCVGSKASLKSLISDITNIPCSILDKSDRIDTTSIATRMSWAARRQTTRQEDMAYCLLGLFDVNVPMLYGEGAKAFLRLQEEIIRRTNDRSIFAFSCTPSSQAAGMSTSPQPYSDLFAASPCDFINWTSSGAMGSGLYASEAFALTNKGLYFRTVQLLVDTKRGFYVLTLDDDGNSPNNQLQLRKVGPALYSKYIIPSQDARRDCDVRNEASYSVIEDEVYILSAIAPSLQLRLHHADSYAIHLQSRTHQISKAIQAIQRAPSSNRWDASRMLFLRFGARSIIGFWKVFPSLVQPFTGGGHADVSLSKEHFYLVSGVDANADQEPRAWVKLYTSQEWRRLESMFGIITNLDDVADHKGQSSLVARLQISSSIVAASIELRREQSIFDLSLDFNVNATSQS